MQKNLISPKIKAESIFRYKRNQEKLLLNIINYACKKLNLQNEIINLECDSCKNNLNFEIDCSCNLTFVSSVNY